jgi:rhamnulokinase
MAARERRFIAVDLGASAGRVFAGLVGEQQVRMEELARFDNRPVTLGGTVYWDVPSLLSQIQSGLAEFARRYGPQADGIGLDTWGVDFGLIGADGALLANPVHYRDRRTEGMMEEVFARIPARQIYQITGIQFLQLNTIYQLMAMVRADSPTLAAARTLLFIPDLFNYFLTGRCVSERTIASTSQMLEAGRPQWSQAILQALDLRPEMMPHVLPSGSVVGLLKANLAEEVGLTPSPVIAPACHDTAAAVAAVPAEPGDDWAYVSSGTWSLMGVELAEPLISDQSLAENFTNEAGVAGTVRFLRNIAGLWLLQQCRKIWQGIFVGGPASRCPKPRGSSSGAFTRAWLWHIGGRWIDCGS